VSQFAGMRSLGLAGAWKLTPHVNLTGGVGDDLDHGYTAVRAGFNMSW
jgi:hypothetical protein